MAEIVGLLEREQTDLADASQFTTEVVQTLDADHSGSVSRAEFIEVLQANPLLYDIFAKHIIPGLVGRNSHNAGSTRTWLGLPTKLTHTEC